MKKFYSVLVILILISIFLIVYQAKAVFNLWDAIAYYAGKEIANKEPSFGGFITYGNNTTTGWLNVGTTDVVNTFGDLIGAGDLYIAGNATSAVNFHAPEFCLANDCITAWAGGDEGSPGSWHTLWTNTLTPTNTSAGIYVQASSTITGLRVDGNLSLVGDLTDHYGSACGAGDFITDIADDGTFTCGTPVGGEFTSNWHESWADTLTPTNTSAGIYVLASSTITGLRVDGDLAVSGNYLNFKWEYITDVPTSTTDQLPEGATNLYWTSQRFTDALLATSTLALADLSLTGNLTDYFGAACGAGEYISDITDDGTFTCATPVGTLGQAGSFDTLWTNTLAPTNTSAGIYVWASSTINSTLNVNGAAVFNDTVNIHGVATTTATTTIWGAKFYRLNAESPTTVIEFL